MRSAALTLRDWVPTLLLKVLLLDHVLLLVIVIAMPALWPWVLFGFIVSHLLIVAGGLVPRAAWLGPNTTRLPATGPTAGCVAITIDDGPDPHVTPAVLDLLERHRARATFFCIGDRVLAHPQLAREIVRRGHTIENHSLHHFYRFSILGPWKMAREVLGGADAIATVTGRRPTLFRAPAGFRNPFLEPILARSGLRLVSWTRRGFDTVEKDPAIVGERLLRRLAAGDILLLHDGRAACCADGRPVILAVLPEVLTAIRRAGLNTTTLPPHDVRA
jgi:peptidoglycan/xylan/chitin deacetylase (PgdA/CDA1 family)